MRRSTTALAIITVFIMAAGAQAQIKLDMDVEFGWELCYRPSQWMPVNISIYSQLDHAFEGTVEVSAQQDSMNIMTVYQGFVLTPDLPAHIPLVIKLAFAADECRIRVSDSQGRTVLREDRPLWDSSSTQQPLTAVQEDELLIGVIGNRKFSLPLLSDYSASITEGDTNRPSVYTGMSAGGGGKVHIKHKLERMACWDWTGFVGLDLLILYDPKWDQLHPEQLTAISQWIGNGGKLLVVMGANPLPAESAVAEILPFELGPAQQVVLPPTAIQQWNWSLSEPPRVVGRPLRPKLSSRIYQTVSYETDKSLFGTGYVGFGRVGVLAFDPALIDENDPQNRVHFWVKHIAAVLEDESHLLNRSIIFQEKKGDVNYDAYTYSSYALGQADSGLTAVLNRLTNIPELKPLSIWWVIFLLTLLALLLGPVDYFVLKRRDRQPWTWLTCIGWIVLFSVGAYYGVQALRGGQMRVRTVSVWDGVQGRGDSWSATYSGLFAPASDEYHLDLKETFGKQWWSGIAPSGDYYYAYEQKAGRNIFYSQRDGENRPLSLPINIWTMQTMLAEAPQPRLPINAVLRRQGPKINLRITNYSENALKQGYVLFDQDQALAFGAVAAGETREITGELSARKMWHPGDRYELSRYYDNYPPSYLEVEAAYFARGSLQRTQMILGYLRHGAAVVCAEFDNTPAPFDVIDKNCRFEHTQLVRQVVFPQER
ncbi:MAG: hypothetical protein AMJ79_01025 [Phycisphaerae bacterium SM23_30]|nr:MAG: hypothetical protein AMJ79_01025 [Phycisphaerae bacterium SM23_30]